MKQLAGVRGWVICVAVVAGAVCASGAQAQPASPAPPDTVATGGESGMARPEASPEARPPYKIPPLMKAVTDDLHNKLIHFPIVLTLVAAAMLIVARKRPELESVAFWLVWMAALSVIPAYFSGKAQEEQFHGKPKEWLVEIHEKQGITIGIIQALWVLSLLKAGTRRWAWVIGLVLAVMVSASGFIGGLVAHGR